MAQSVSNDALWVKLSEMDKKLDELSVNQKTQVSTQEIAENKPDFTNVKEDVITKIKNEILILGLSNDSHHEANKQNNQTLNDNIIKVLNVVSRIRKQQRETIEPPEKKEACFNFWFFKVRKTSLVIATLGVLVFILTLFCMKQQNDYALLMNECYRQNITIEQVKNEVDSLRSNTKTDIKGRRK